MGKTFWATAVMIGFAAVANAAPQSIHKDGAVVAVDREGKSLTVQSGFSNSTYKTTDHTMFLVGTAPTNWGAVKIGEKSGSTITSTAGTRLLTKSRSAARAAISRLPLCNG